MKLSDAERKRIDAILALRVMGWFTQEDNPGWKYGYYDKPNPRIGNFIISEEGWKPTVDAQQAFDVRTEVTVKHRAWRFGVITYGCGKHASAMIAAEFDVKAVMREADTEAEATCLATLSWFEVDESEWKDKD